VIASGLVGELAILIQNRGMRIPTMGVATTPLRDLADLLHPLDFPREGGGEVQRFHMVNSLKLTRRDWVPRDLVLRAGLA
jgi:hypothetical protein